MPSHGNLTELWSQRESRTSIIMTYVTVPATNRRRAGVPTSVVMRVMGWRSIRMFQRYDSVKTDDLLQGAQQHDNWKPDTLMTPTIKEAEIGKGAMSQALDRTKREVLVIRHAPVAQLDRASGFEPAGRRFNSCRAHHSEIVGL
jgi:hypothetical protein